MITVAIDPGLRASGCAVFKSKTLVRAAAVLNPNKKDRGLQAWIDMAVEVKDWLGGVLGWAGVVPVDALVIESQQIYRGFKANPDDILQLTGVSAACAMGIPAVKYVSYLPRDWKGQVPRTVYSNRVWSKLTDEEREAVEPCSKDAMHDVTHAIGLGWVFLGVER